MRRAVVESWERLVAEELAVMDGDPDDVIIDSGDHLLSCERTEGRWELDPASADDYGERRRAPVVAQKWRHFGH
jgi:hypothetical protein